MSSYQVGFVLAMSPFLYSRRLKSTALLSLLAITAAAPLGAQQWGENRSSSQSSALRLSEEYEADITELYLQVFRLSRESEQFAGQKSWRSAMRKAKDAEMILARIVRDHPRWRPNLVDMRRKIIAKNLESYRKFAKDETVGSARNLKGIIARPFDPERTAWSVNPNESLGNADNVAGNVENKNLDVIPGAIENNRDMYNELMRTREELRRMANAYNVLRKNHRKAQQELIVTKMNYDIDKKRHNNLKLNIEIERKAGNHVVSALTEQLASLEAKFKTSQQARILAETRAENLEISLSKLEQDHSLVLRERDALKTENARLREIVELNSPEKIKALLDQNITLSSQLKQAQTRVDELNSQLSSHGDEQDVLLVQLQEARGETARLQMEIERLYDENLGYRRRIAELNERTNELERDLEILSAKPTMDPAMKEENQVLRGIVTKQKRTLKAQEDARKLLIDTYKHIKNQDPQLLAALDELDAQSSLDLTELENALITAVQSADANGDADADASARESLAGLRQGLEVEALTSGAFKAFQARRYTAAEQLYRTLVDANPDNLAGLVNLATILVYRNKCADAIPLLERAERLSPELPVIVFMRAVAHYQINQLDEAERFFKRSLELNPASADSFFYLANIESVKGMHEQALKHLAATLKLKPSFSDAHYNMSRIYIEMDKLPEAARAYDRSIHGGSQPDIELEQYIATHLDKSLKAGEDIIATIEPQAEVAKISLELATVEKVSADGKDKAEENPDEKDREGRVKENFLSMQKEVEQTVKKVSMLSPAEGGHKHSANRFGTQRVKVGTKSVKLRVKKGINLRLRKRGGVLPSAIIKRT